MLYSLPDMFKCTAKKTASFSKMVRSTMREFLEGSTIHGLAHIYPLQNPKPQDLHRQQPWWPALRSPSTWSPARTKSGMSRQCQRLSPPILWPSLSSMLWQFALQPKQPVGEGQLHWGGEGRPLKTFITSMSDFVNPRISTIPNLSGILVREITPRSTIFMKSIFERGLCQLFQHMCLPLSCPHVCMEEEEYH